MATDDVRRHPHLLDPKAAESRRFTSPQSGPRERMKLPPRGRAAHARHLLAQLEAIEPEAKRRAEEQKAQGIDAGFGVYLAFESEPDFELKFESLEFARSGIELCAIKLLSDKRTQATVFVPDGKLGFFLKRITDYRDAETTPRTPGGPVHPKHQQLVESIANIKLAALEALWTETSLAFPKADEMVTWEVWLRRSNDGDQLDRLRQYATTFNLTVGEQAIKFIDRTVVLVLGKAKDLSRSIEIIGAIAELRLAKTPASFFTGMTAKEQQEWAEDLAKRLTPPPNDSPYVCLFDTGVNSSHPLLAAATNTADHHTYRPAWGVDDREGHGTPMAGLAVYGDLADLLGSSHTVGIGHRIESVKIINSANPHSNELYGAVTQESVYRVEVTPGRKRVYCMAVTATDDRDRGRPSSWSAAVDALASGMADSQRRLLILSAGNTDQAQRRHYPHSNMTDSVHDPAQSWNALTVGGYTEKAFLDAAKNPGWQPLALRGDLAPCSCTSATWTRTRWPIKPDIVLEAGNMASNPAFADPDYIDDALQLLSTNHDFTMRKPLTSFGDTSAATALAARLAAMLWSKYPNFTPETIRALLVHAAEWTPAMLTRFADSYGNIDYEALLRCFGYGVPSFPRLISSADNSLTLIAQGTIQPFFKEDDRIKTRELRLHALPWPIDALRDLQNTVVKMRVTLSYFVEPSPGARGWSSKYGYQSHGLRFAVKTALEGKKAFEQRINKFAREDGYDPAGLKDTGRWMFGYPLRSLVSLGSLHSDVWTGTAVDLAARGHIAVFPTIGWWNKRPNLGSWEKQANYSLIVSITTPETGVDIYTPVASQIGVPIVIEV